MRTEMKGSIKHTALNLLSSRVILRKFIIPYPQEFIWCGRQLSNIALISIATHEFLLYALNVALLMLDTFEGENLAECKCMTDYPTVCHVADGLSICYRNLLQEGGLRFNVEPFGLGGHIQ